MKSVTIDIPELHAAQNEILQNATRFNVVCCGRRWGKTVFGEDRAIEYSLAGKKVGWFAPTYKYLTESWEKFTTILNPVISRANSHEKLIRLDTGGSIEMWTLDSGDAGRSRGYHLVIVDEAAKVPNLLDAWNASIRPTLSDYRGSAWFLSTPRGNNGFKALYQRGLDDTYPKWSCWRKPTTTNPTINDDEIEDARRSLPERIFRQEYLADFIEDSGTVFRGLRKAVVDKSSKDVDRSGHDYVIGVDWGKRDDYTVFTVLDINLQEIVAVHRYTKIDYHFQRKKLELVAKDYNPLLIVVEQNSVGEANYEELYYSGLPVVPFVTMNASKTRIIENLANAIETQKIKLPNDEILLGELEAFECERLASGRFRYRAPHGFHDDCVMSAALALEGICVLIEENSDQRLVYYDDLIVSL